MQQVMFEASSSSSTSSTISSTISSSSSSAIRCKHAGLLEEGSRCSEHCVHHITESAGSHVKSSLPYRAYPT